MTKKHLNALAAEIARITDPAERKRITEILGGICANLNPRFDWDRWRSACRVG